ncbi:MAG TPA: ABC-2 transporter permease [Candidatus Limiplasma sp.]|nr:ABC-2 transporter permease [Candidatus Limiplasma sp.]HPS81611.1 ABC-2 transporter permease [Candidatus Limiplasma sp.]
MLKLLRKEIRLALHPTNVIFLTLSAMLMIPNYPYYVTFFYTTLGLFFLCLNGRENNDVEFSVSLPVPKQAVVQGRIAFAMLVELAQLALAVPFAILRHGMSPAINEVGMDANVAFFGLSLLMFGLFNILFFPAYYQNPNKVGKAYVKSSVLLFLYITVAEALTHVAPLFRDQLDTPDPLFMNVKLMTLAIGAVGFVLLSGIAYAISAKRFVALDLA